MSGVKGPVKPPKPNCKGGPTNDYSCILSLVRLGGRRPGDLEYRPRRSFVERRVFFVGRHVRQFSA
jgi:hypothetical protein